MTRPADTGQRPDPRERWPLRLPPPTQPQPQPSPSPHPSPSTSPSPPAQTDTLLVDANAIRWAELAAVLADADVPLEVGDVAALRRLSKLDSELVAVVIRWIRTARPGHP
ncbi:hypothetical protein [Kitasatospora sp. GAS1066B]|uniref:hypothetical protein n=1 Tax=Kitasatospora sp. GAS1066B TaxID=3156271 RepID=UPI0035170C22